jgi:hypothetical protein
MLISLQLIILDWFIYHLPIEVYRLRYEVLLQCILGVIRGIWPSGTNISKGHASSSSVFVLLRSLYPPMWQKQYCSPNYMSACATSSSKPCTKLTLHRNHRSGYLKTEHTESLFLLRRHLGNWPRGPAVSKRSELLVAHKKLGQLLLLTVYVVPVKGEK